MEEVLSKLSTKELIEALKLKEDVQITETGENAYKLSIDLLKVKKHVLVINNCNPKLIEHQSRVLEGPEFKQDLHKVSDTHAK
ncbi:hypothetical protein CN327_09670 [Bacillus cereus]|nr:hypothetical protein CN509_11815 [Bacillus cereus]PES99236.1 hypothetical protein CN505_27365 [Bacillus cereus]PFF34445.1 hypothetical protein CN327_09670 [Bacillus cereus]PFI48272.1 hypothetical protein COI73_12175 [Bacillus cereus]